MKRLCFSVLSLALLTLTASAFEYDVRQPGDALRPKWFAADTKPGVWTLNVTNALAKAQADGKCTIILNTASWWCPYCETLESTVLDSEAWYEYLAEEGYYLALLDFPYRNEVPAGQEWKSWYPELGKGWGFKCWLMYSEYLKEIGLTKEQGLDAIMDLYKIQKELALETASQITISNWTHTAEFTYGKVGYPTFIIVGTNGVEMGRTGFPWYRVSDVTPSEAQEYVIQSIDQIAHGACRLCEDPLAGTPPITSAQTYTGWISSGENGIEGLVEFKTSKANAKGKIKVRGSVTIGGRKITLNPITTYDINEYVTLTRKSAVAIVKFGEVGLGGIVTYDGKKYDIVGGGRNVFTAKDEDAQARAMGLIKGVWNVVLKTTESDRESSYTRGYGTLTVELKAKGKAKISGTMGDGTKVSVSSQVVYGEDNVACLPVLASMYSKKGGFGFVMWFRNGKLYSITEVAPWVAAGKWEFTAKVQPSFTMSDGYGEVEDELEFSLVGFDKGGTIKGYDISDETDPTYDDITVKKSSWKGTEETSFKATCSTKTGALKGSMYFKVVKANGRTANVKGVFTGVVMGGSGYGTVYVAKEGTWAAKIAVCGGCSD